MYEVIDLSIGSLDIPGFINADNLEDFNQLIIPKTNENKILIGRYSESRLMYLHDTFIHEENEFSAWRVIHLGIDLFTNPQRKIFAPTRIL